MSKQGIFKHVAIKIIIGHEMSQFRVNLQTKKGGGAEDCKYTVHSLVVVCPYFARIHNFFVHSYSILIQGIINGNKTFWTVRTSILVSALTIIFALPLIFAVLFCSTHFASHDHDNGCMMTIQRVQIYDTTFDSLTESIVCNSIVVVI